MSFKDLLNKQIPIPESTIKHFDNSNDYVVVKKTKKGLVKKLKPEVVKKIKQRIENEPL